MEMEAEPAEPTEPARHIRETSRLMLQQSRRSLREEQSDSRRFTATSTNPVVSDIVNKLKTKASVSAEELRMLKNALMDDVQHVETMLRTQGAVRGLVREVLGHDVRKRSNAIGCCCNLALSERGGLTIAKAAGSYLVNGLDSQSEEIVVSCAWTLGNVAGSGAEARHVALAQGALGKLLAAAGSGSQEIAGAASYGLRHFLYGLKAFGPDQVTQLLATPFVSNNLASSSHILYMLSWDPDFKDKVSVELLHKILDHFSVSTQSLLEDNNMHQEDSSYCNFKYLVRLLANICSETSEKCNLVMEYFVKNNFVASFTQLLDRNTFDLLWLLGNLYKYCDNDMCKNAFFSELLSPQKVGLNNL